MNFTPKPVQQLPSADSVSNDDYILIYKDTDGKAYLADATLFRGADGRDATINGENALTIVAGDNINLSQDGGTVTLSANISGVFIYKGSATLATLPPLAAANLGFTYNMMEPFITTADFIEGAGKEYSAGADVAVADAGNGAYKYDVLSISLSGLVPETRQINGHALSADVTLAKSDVGLGNADNTSDANKPISAATQAALNEKVDKIAGKGLSTEDYTTAEKVSLAAVKALLQNAVLYRKASGNPATFSDGKAANLKAISVTIAPTQSGSGDPSPDNVRPVVGFSSVTVTRTGENGANPQSVSVQLTDGANPLTVYGGTLDVAAGTLSVTHKLTALPATGWYLENNNRFAHANVLTGRKPTPDNSSIINAVCSHYKPASPQNTWTSRANIFSGAAGANSGTAYVVDTRFTAVSDFQAWLAETETPPQVCYELAAPLTYQFTPAQLAALAGYNAVSSDAGTLSVTYLSDPEIALGGGV